jgi:ribonuclease Z
MKIKVLGSGSATPYLGRYSSSLLLNIDSELFLFDCGEGIQMQLLAYNQKIAKLNNIFISHLHGDHYLGLIGLISSMNSWGRKHTLNVYAPPGLKEILSIQFKYQQTSLNFELNIFENNTQEGYIIFENKKMIVSTIPLSHRIPCCGFLVKEKEKLKNLIKDKITPDMLLQHIQTLKLGNDVIDESGKTLYEASKFTSEPEKPKTFAYCTDTIFDKSLVEKVKNADLLYHEATFTDEHEARAETTFHSTAKQAATIACEANVNKLLIGHFSSRYKNTNAFENESKAIFPNTILAIEGLEVQV